MIKKFVACLGLLALCCSTANAGLINFTIQQVGSDVVLTGEGSFNLTGLGSSSYNPLDAGLGGTPLEGPFYRVGQGTNGVEYNVAWLPAVGASAFGTSLLLYTTIASGDRAGFHTRAASSRIFVTSDYVSGSNLFGTATFQNTNLEALGLKVGDSATFTYQAVTGGYGGVVNISAVPEPTSLLMVGSLIGLGFTRRRRA